MKAKILLTALIVASCYGSSSAQCSVNSTTSSYCGSGDAIQSFILAGVASTGNSGCSSSSGYSFFSTPVRQLSPGSTYTFSATITNSSFPQGFAIWIDLNGNNIYESSEQVYKSSTYATSHSGSITIPTTASGGKVRMRTMCCYYYIPGPSEACTAPSYAYYGEVEDYWVSVCEPATYSLQPDPDVYACEDANVSLKVSSTNAGAYQWQMFSGSSFQDIQNNTTFSGATTDKLSITKTPSTLDGAKIRCVIMPSCSNKETPSDTVTLPVFPNVQVASQTTIDTSCVGLTTSLSFKPKGTVTQREWQIYDNTLGDWVPITGAPFVDNGNVLDVNGIPDTLNGARIRCIVTGICGKDTTDDMNMVVNALPAVVTSPTDITVNQGDDAPFKVVAAGVGVRYQWQAAPPKKDSFANINNNAIYSGVKTPILTVNHATRAQDGYQFRCVIKGSGSCQVQPDSSDPGILYVMPTASVGNLNGFDGTVQVYPNPASGSEVVVTIDADNLSDKLTYKLTDKLGRTISIGNIINPKSTKVNITQLASDVYTIQILDEDHNVINATRFTKL